MFRATLLTQALLSDRRPCKSGKSVTSRLPRSTSQNIYLSRSEAPRLRACTSMQEIRTPPKKSLLNSNLRVVLLVRASNLLRQRSIRQILSLNLHLHPPSLPCSARFLRLWLPMAPTVRVRKASTFQKQAPPSSPHVRHLPQNLNRRRLRVYKLPPCMTSRHKGTTSCP